jgi:cytochrome c5
MKGRLGRVAALVLAVLLIGTVSLSCKNSVAPTTPPTAVAPATPTASSTEAPKTTAAEPAAAPTQAQVDPVALIKARCAMCHSLDRVRAEKADADQWRQIVHSMKAKMDKRGKGTLTDQEAETIAGYLSTHKAP